MKTPYLTKDEVCALTGWTPRYVEIQVAAGNLEYRTNGTRLRNGRIAKEFALASLPAEARAKYLDGQSEPAASGMREQTSVPPSPLSLAPLLGEQPAAGAVQISPVRVALPPAAESEAARRVAILKPLIEYGRAPEPPALTRTELVKQLAAEYGVSKSQIWEWKKRFDKEGSFGLARKPRADKHRSAWAADNRELADLAALVYMGNGEQPAQSKTVAWEAVCERARRIGTPAPSYETVRAFLENKKDLSRSMVTYGRDGRRKYEAQFSPFITRSYVEPANSIWMADHFICDVLVQDNLFGRDLKHLRPQATVIFDYRSRKVLAIAFAKHGSSHTIKRALRIAIQRYGLPDRFYCDNGKDFIKVAKGASERDLMLQARRSFLKEAHEIETGFLARVGVPVTFCMIYHGQSKGEERWHRTFHDRFDRSFSTYTAGETHLRPENTIAATIQHGKLLRMGQPQNSSLRLASEYVHAAEAWIEQWYHKRPHGGRGMDNRSPDEVFEQERGANRPCPEAAELAMLLPDRCTRKVANMQIELDGDYFVADPADAYADFQMHELGGQRVTIAYDPLDPMFAAVLDDDGFFLCRLQRKNLIRFSADDETRDQVKGMIANRNGKLKAVRESISDLNRRVQIAGYTSLEEQHMQRLELPRAVGDNIVQQPQRPIEDSGYKETHSDDIVAQYFQRRERAHGTQG